MIEDIEQASMSETIGHIQRTAVRRLAGFAVAPPAAVFMALLTYDRRSRVAVRYRSAGC